MRKHLQSMHIYLNILNMLKDSLYICVHIISTVVCRVCKLQLPCSHGHSLSMIRWLRSYGQSHHQTWFIASRIFIAVLIVVHKSQCCLEPSTIPFRVQRGSTVFVTLYFTHICHMVSSWFQTSMTECQVFETPHI